MAKKKMNSSGGLVYSTDPGFRFPEERMEEEQTPEPDRQELRIRLDTRHRAGKAVTLVEGFRGSVTDREELGKKLKSICGTGGSVKDGAIMVQGDNRDKILQWLLKSGYKMTRKI